jgi:curved DNA-binding protein CbpA
MSSDVQELIDRVIKNKDDYYKVLNLEKGSCDDKKVKKSYHKIALRIHPDKCSLPG